MTLTNPPFFSSDATRDEIAGAVTLVAIYRDAWEATRDDRQPIGVVLDFHTLCVIRVEASTYSLEHWLEQTGPDVFRLLGLPITLSRFPAAAPRTWDLICRYPPNHRRNNLPKPEKDSEE